MHGFPQPLLWDIQSALGWKITLGVSFFPFFVPSSYIFNIYD